MLISKRLMALLLALLMVVSILPMGAMAETVNAESKGETAEDLVQAMVSENLEVEPAETEDSNETKSDSRGQTRDTKTAQVLSDSKANGVMASTSQPYEVWDTFEFGSYPQSKETDNTVIQALNNSTAKSNGYYKYNNDEYAKVGSNYYKVEPLVWRVAKYYDDNSIIIMTDNVIDSQVFNNTSSNLTWKDCTLRKWLNEDFYNRAFTAGEKSCIHETELDNSAARNKFFNYGTEDTKDKVFLFSHGDLTDKTFNFNTDDRYDDPQRISKSTDYAQAMGAGSGYCNYWTRSHSATQVQYVLSSDGCVGSCHSPAAANSTGYGVRPVMVADKNSGFYKSINKIGESVTVTFYDTSVKKEVLGKSSYKALADETVTVSYGTKEDTYKTNSSGKAEIKIPDVSEDEQISFSVDGYYKHIMLAGAITDSTFSINMKLLDENGKKPYVSSVYIKTSGAGYWRENVTIDEEDDDKYDIIMCVDWNGHKEGKYYLSQDGAHKMELTDGKATDVVLTKTFDKSVPNIYAYCVSSDGTRSEAVKTGIDIKNKGLEKAFGEDSEISILGQDGLTYTLPSSIPIVGGSKVGLNFANAPLSVIIDDNGIIRIAIGITLFEDSEENKLPRTPNIKKMAKNGMSVEQVWTTLVESVDDINSIKKNIKKMVEKDHASPAECQKEWKKAAESYKNLDTLRKGLLKDKITGKILQDESVDVEFYGYWVGKIENGVPKQTEGCGVSLGITASSSFSQMTLIGPVPVYGIITGEIELKAAASGSKPTADKDEPLAFDLDIQFTPALELGVGVGIPKFLSLELDGKGALPIEWFATKRYITIDLELSAYVKVQAWLLNYKLDLASKTWNIVSSQLGRGSPSSPMMQYGGVQQGSLTDESNYTELVERCACKWVGTSTPKNTMATSDNSCGVECSLLEKDSVKAENILVSANGVTLSIMLRDDSLRPTADLTQLAYTNTKKSGSAVPVPVDNSDLLEDSVKTADFMPSAAAIGKNIFIAWQNINKSLGDIPEDSVQISDYSPYAEICVAKYDTTTGKMSDKIVLTNDSALDTMPVVTAGPGGSAYVVWVSNSDAQYFLDSGVNTIKYCNVSSDMKQGAVKVAANNVCPVQAMTAAYDGKNLMIATAQDTDWNLDDNSDLELFLNSVNSLGVATGKKLTNNNVVESSPVFKNRGNLFDLTWYEGKNLKVKTSFSLASAGMLDAEADGEAQTEESIIENVASDDYDIAYNSDGEGYIVWCQPVDGHVELYGSHYDGSTWSKAFAISNLGKKISDPSALCEEDGSLSVLCNCTEQELTGEGDTAFYMPGTTDTVILTYVPGADLYVVSNAIFDEEEIVPGEDTLIPVTVYNNGMDCDGFTVSIDGETVYESDDVLAAGDSIEVELPYTYPDRIVHTILNIEVSATGTEETDTDNNATTAEYGFSNARLSDMVIDDYPSYAQINLAVENRSNVDAGEQYLMIYDGDSDGTQLGSFGYDSLEAWHYGAYNLIVDKDGLTYDENGFAHIYAELTDADGYIIDSTSQVIEKHEYSGALCTVLDLTCADGNAVAFLNIENDAEDSSQGFLTVTAKDENGNVLGTVKRFLDMMPTQSISMETSIPVSDSAAVADITAEYADCGHIYDYTVNDDGNITIDKYYGSEASLEIPSEINGIPVTALAGNLFAGNEALQEITIGSNIVSIGPNCFTGCKNLSSVNIDEANEAVSMKDGILYTENGSVLYFALKNAKEEITLENSVRVIATGAFEGDKTLKKITFNDGLTEICESAFADCSQLREIRIPDSVEKIGAYAFSNCGAAEVIHIGDGVREISGHTFENCGSVKEIYLGKALKKIGRDCFNDCASLEKLTIYSEYLSKSAENMCIFKNAGTESGGFEVVIGKNVRVIPDYFFYSNDTYTVPVTRVDMGSAKVSVGNSAFCRCTQLEEVVNAENISAVNPSAFRACTSLKAIDMHSSDMESISDSAFSNCTSLATVILPSSLKTIDASAFYNCAALTQIELPSSLKTIDASAFYNCAALTQIDLPDSLETIGASAFYGCSGLQNIELKENLISVGDNAFYSCYGVKQIVINCPEAKFGSNVFYYAGSNSGGTLVVIGDKLTEVPASLFSSSYYISEVYIGRGVTSIGANAFSGCSSLKEVSGCRNVETIGNSAFYGCSNLTSIKTTDNLKTIGSYAFYNCYNLESIIIGNKVKEIQPYTFYQCTKLTSVELPDDLASIGQSAFQYCTALTEIDIPDSVESIGQSAFQYCTALTEIDIPDSVESIGQSAFANCTGLTTVNIGSGIYEIGQYAFANNQNLESITFADAADAAIMPSNALRGCTSIKSVDGCVMVDGILYSADMKTIVGTVNTYFGTLVIPDTVEIISEEAFNGCSVDNLVIPDSVTEIRDRAFYGCNIKSVTFGKNVLIIGSYAFYGNNSLTNFELPARLRSIGSYAFYNLNYITELNIPDSVEEIGDYAFYNCSKLTELNIGNGVERIGDYAFYSVANITSLVIPDSVRTVGAYAFYGAAYCREITIGEGVETIGTYAFYNATRLETLNFNAVNCADLAGDVFYRAGYTSGSVSVVFGENVKRIPGYFTYPTSTNYRPRFTSFAFSESIEEIGDYAFYDFDAVSMGELNLPHLKTVGSYAFYSTDVQSINSAELQRIGNYAFCSCNALTEISLPDTMQSVGNYAFYYCSALESVDFGNGELSIGSYVLRECNALKTLTLGENISSVDPHAFDGLYYLTTLNYNITNYPDLPSSSSSYAWFYRLGYNSSGVTLNVGENVERIPAYLFYPYNNNSSYWNNIVQVNIAAEEIEIGDYAFYYCSNLAEVNANRITRAGSYAFQNCTKLNSFNAALCGFIGGSAFCNAGSLQGMILANGIDTVGSYAFNGSKVTEISLPDTVQSVGSYAFNNCSALKSFDFGNGELSIGSYVLRDCNALKTLTLGENISSVAANAFYGIYYLTTLNYNITNYPDLPSSSSSYAWFYRLGYNSSGATLNVGENVERIPAYLFSPYDNNSSNRNNIVQVNIAAEEIEIGDYAFYYCNNISKVNANRITRAGSYAFCRCENLNSFNATLCGFIGDDAFCYAGSLQGMILADGIDSIGSYAFCGSRVTEISLPDTVQSVGSYAFRDCNALKTLTLGENISCVDPHAFESLYYLTTLNYNITNYPDLPSNSSSYAWFYRLGRSGTGVTLNVGENVERIPAYLFYLYDNNSNNWNNIVQVNIAAEEIEIGDYAFYYCNNISKVNANRITRAGSYAFCRCENLNSFNATLCGNIGDYAFCYAGSLQGMILADGIDSIGSYAFYGSRVTKISLPDTVEYVGSYAFSNCNALTTLTLGENISCVDPHAFENLYYLRTLNYNITNYPDLPSNSSSYAWFYRLGRSGTGVTLNVGENVERIPAYLFCLYNNNSSDWNNITAVNCGSSLSEIGSYAFYYCSNLSSLNLNDGLESIGSYAFRSTALNKVSVPATTQIESSAFNSGINMYGFAGSPAESYADGGNAVWHDLSGADANIERLSFRENAANEIYVGETAKLQVSTAPVDNIFPSLTWESSDTDVLSVDENGTVTGVSEGTATVTATAKNGVSTEIEITVLMGTDITGAVVDVREQVEYTGDECAPAVKLTLDGVTVPAIYYTVEYSNNTDIGTATVTVTARGRYYGTASTEFEILCLHGNSDYEVLEEASCTEEGLAKCTCYLCGEEFEEVIPTVPHSFNDWIVDKEASYTEEGSMHLECAECGEVVETVPIEKLDDYYAPEAELTVKDTVWNYLLSYITFGLYTNDSVKVTITAEDYESGVSSIEYIISDVVLTQTQLEVHDGWNSYTEPFELSGAEGEKKIVYARVTDNCGNMTMLSSDGMVFDISAPVFEGVEDNGAYCFKAIFSINDNNLSTVMIDGEQVNAKNIYVIDEPGNHVVSAEDIAGNVTEISFTVNDDHIASEWIIDKEATYKDYGHKHIECAVCGEVLYTENFIELCSHENTVTADARPANCTEKGYTGDLVCMDCGCIIYKGAEIPAAGHSFDAGICVHCGEKDPNYVVPELINPFVDVSEGTPYYNAILWAYYHEPQITGGFGKGYFLPYDLCTRAQVVTFLWRAAGCPEPESSESPFFDVVNEGRMQPYYKAILWAAENGITTGYANGAFMPQDTVTRAQFVTFLWRYEGKPASTGTVTDFADASEILSPYRDAVAWAIERGITTGFTDNTFRPADACRRWTVLLFMYRDLV